MIFPRSLALSFSLLWLIIISPACNKSDGIVIYPMKFVYNNIEFDNTLCFIANGPTSFQEIQPEGTFTSFHDTILIEITFQNINFPFDELVLLSDSKVRLRIVNQGTPEPIDTVLNYNFLTSEFLRIMFNDVGDEYIDINYTQGEDQMTYFLLSYSYSYSENGMTEYSPINVENFTDIDTNAILNKIFIENNLSIGDTVAINTSYVVFNKG
jgi:hypothetical protein